MCHESTSVGLAAGDRHRQGLGQPAGHPRGRPDRHLRPEPRHQPPADARPRWRSPSATAPGSSRSTRCARPACSSSTTRRRRAGWPGCGTDLADEFLQIRSDGDLALWQAHRPPAARAEEARAPGTVVDRDFIERHTVGFEAWAAHIAAVDRDAVLAATGLTWAQIERAARRCWRRSKRIVNCWAMGITQHRNAVATIKEFVNVALLQGMIGKPGAGLCPVRGHSNVQGDRTMGIWEQLAARLPRRARAPSSASSRPREHGLDAVDAVRALRDGAGQGVRRARRQLRRRRCPTPTSPRPRCAVVPAHRAGLHQAQPLHVAAGARRADPARPWAAPSATCTGGREQRVTVEDSMSAVHASRGPLDAGRSSCCAPRSTSSAASPRPRSATGTASRGRLRDGLRPRSATASAASCPAARTTTRRSRAAAASPCRTRRATAAPSRPRPARPCSRSARWRSRASRQGRLVLQTIRSHDQFNTTIYGLDDRYRGIHYGRRVVFISRRRPARARVRRRRRGRPGQRVGRTAWSGAPTASGWSSTRRPKGCVAGVLPGDQPAGPAGLDRPSSSNTPTSKWVVVRLEPAAG